MMKIEISPMKGQGKCPHCGMELGEKDTPAHEAAPMDPMEDKAEVAPPKKKKFKSLDEVKAFAKKKYG